MKKKMIAGLSVVAVMIEGLICFCIWFLSGTGNKITERLMICAIRKNISLFCQWAF